MPRPTEMLDRTRPVLLAGPTASGKSALAMEIAAFLGGPVVNADALQVYSDWRVLTARPSEADEEALPHRLYGHVPGERPYSVGDWLREVAPLLDGPPPVIVGGTGLYFTALTEGLADIPETPPEVREEATMRIEAEGHRALLADLDDATVARIDTANPMRVQRAWEVLRATGRGLAAWQNRTPQPILPLDAAQALLIDAPKDWLTPRIERRFDAMLQGGALEEARRNAAGWRSDLPSAKAIGATELVAHVRGEMALEDARAAAIVATRQYAKRQRTWFRARMKAWRPIGATT
ncbi:tRNA (adenosine(37)-N6)-dimethylallyltransferase MiaA [Silicimonas algicola]|uniref:tRNA dimethylallyltransferase n=1 Tax=Silicimonas algicola TaxID=1826607 RepID=A0A316GQJ7_9RHOB|nr:tRNA (adenosine(37)-N6)-dimethylallyltransferase MiaA [Silicimonas algicola]PWK57247.1 tRNA dimethylallyltransferase [Silicimonas algicola]